MFYAEVKATVQHVGITTAFGRCNTGKSMASEVALSIFGQQRMATLHKATIAKAMVNMNR